MNTSRVTVVTVAALVLVLAGITINWWQVGRSVAQHGPPASTGDVSVSPEIRNQRNRNLAAAFVEGVDSLSDEDYRRAALAYEEQKQAQRVVAKRTANPGDPSAPYRRWRQRVEKVQQMVDANDEFPEGSVQWHMREELKQLLREKPRQR